jgi:hypothetical protein
MGQIWPASVFFGPGVDNKTEVMSLHSVIFGFIMYLIFLYTNTTDFNTNFTFRLLYWYNKSSTPQALVCPFCECSHVGPFYTLTE